jgi:2-polyprenyl-3-methyl-5-hydroxy-6-metoxy-1,4-benzoquinol methylase
MVWDPVWENIFRKQAWGKYPAEDLIRFIARNFYAVPDRSQVKILEVGCGPGANLWYMAREGFTVYGIDGSETAIKEAQARLDAEVNEWQGEVIVGDLLNLPYEDAFFDAVIDNEAIYSNSYEDAKQIYNNIYRVLKTNGKLFVRTFATGSYGDGTGLNVGHRAYNVAEGPMLNKGYSRFTDAEDIQDLFMNYVILEKELITRTVENMTHKIKEFIIIAQKF